MEVVEKGQVGTVTPDDPERLTCGLLQEVPYALPVLRH
jgi:hypothetical protein